MNAPFDLLIVGGRVVTGQGVEAADIGIRNGRIAEIGDLGGQSASETINARGLHVLPGAIDTQVHFREPGLTHKEDLESGSRAALYGGVTTFFDEPNVQPTTTTREALEQKLALASGRCWANFGFFIGASTENLGQLAELEMLPGVPGIGEVFMGSSTGPLLVETDDDLRRVLQNGRQRCAIHAEDEARLRERKSLLSAKPHAREHYVLRDAEAARLATERILRLSEETGRPVHILHVSSADELPLIEDAKRRGLGTTCEVTPQHLTFAEALYERLGNYAQMNPPIRDNRHRAAIEKAVRQGLFDVVGSDHAPHTRQEKDQPYPQSPSGMPGVQTLLPAMLNWVHKGLMSLPRLVQMTAENPARIFGLRDRGVIRPHAHADLVVLDPEASFVVETDWLQSKCGWSPFEGMTLHGQPRHVVVNGHWSLREGAIEGSPAGQMCEFDWK